MDVYSGVLVFWCSELGHGLVRQILKGVLRLVGVSAVGKKRMKFYRDPDEARVIRFGKLTHLDASRTNSMVWNMKGKGSFCQCITGRT